MKLRRTILQKECAFIYFLLIKKDQLYIVITIICYQAFYCCIYFFAKNTRFNSNKEKIINFSRVA